MPSVIFEARYNTESRLEGFKKVIFPETMRQLCAADGLFAEQMRLVIPILLKTGWAGKVSPNTDKVLGDVESVYRKRYEAQRKWQPFGKIAPSVLEAMLLTTDGEFRRELYSFYPIDKKFVKKSQSPSKEKVDPWKRHSAVVIAALAYWMALHQNFDRYWALTHKTYSPNDYTEPSLIKAMSTSVRFNLERGNRTDEVTFQQLNKTPTISYTSIGLLADTWSNSN